MNELNWPEKLVEKIAEPSLEHRDFLFRYRHALRPIIGDDPRLHILGRRPP